MPVVSYCTHFKSVYLVNVVFFAECVKSQKHVVDKGNDFHWRYSGTNIIKAVQVAEHDSDTLEVLKQ